jgi:predicted enzyme related to lactoylglutathione lyase
MVTRDTPWEPGTPCWVELMTSDVAGARLFYEELFGWHLEETGPESGGYLLLSLDGRRFGGITTPMGDMEHPPVWNTYLASADVTETARKVTEAGGTVVVGPMDVMQQGAMLVAQDPTGGAICFWQAGHNTGMQVANEPNTPTWNELLTRDYRRAQEFFSALFGYTYDEVGNDDFQYSAFQVDGRGVGGMGSMPPGVPDRVPAHWRVYFEVEDPDEMVDRVVKLGGTVINPPEDTPFGRMARVADPQGAPFSVIHGQQSGA